MNQPLHRNTVLTSIKESYFPYFRLLVHLVPPGFFVKKKRKRLIIQNDCHDTKGMRITFNKTQNVSKLDIFKHLYNNRVRLFFIYIFPLTHAQVACSVWDHLSFLFLHVVL